MRTLIMFLLLLCGTAALAQDVTLKGRIMDSQEVTLESATVYFTKVKDSSIVDYTITDKNGNWEIKTKKQADSLYLKVSFLGLKDYKRTLKGIEQDYDFGTIKLEELPTQLDEVVIESEIPPIRLKKDTLEYNASSFKVRPDANVEALLKQLPGVIISNGKITVNGQEVNQILVGGKPFFGSDGKVALENLPANIIDKVQVSDTKTKQEELSGERAKGNNASINLTIKKDRNKGVFGRVTAGYGTNERYEASGIINYFNSNRRISVLGSSNNINSSGFSFQDFGSMGGGHFAGRSLIMGGGARGAGINRSSNLGFNYSDQWFKNFETNFSYNHTSSTNKNKNRVESTNYLPEGEDVDNPGTIIDNSYISNSSSGSRSTSESDNFNGEFQFKIDSTSTLVVSPRLFKSKSFNSSSLNLVTQRLSDLKVLNESSSSNSGESDNSNFSSGINYYKAFAGRKGRGLNVVLNNYNTSNKSKSFTKSNTIRYRYPGSEIETEVDNRNQMYLTNNLTDNYNSQISYSEPVTDSISLNLSIGHTFNKNVDNRDSFNFNETTQSYTIFNDSLSSYLTSQTATFEPKMSVSLNKKKFNLAVDLGAQITSFKNYAVFIGQDYSFNTNYLLPSMALRASHFKERGESYNFSYRFDSDFPQASQVLPIVDLTDPLHTVIGNPSLDPSKSHSLRFSYRKYNTSRRSGFSIGAGTTFNSDQVVQFTVTDESAKSTTTYRNISGMMSSNLNVDLNKIYQQGEHQFQPVLSAFATYSTNKGFLNGELYNSRSVALSAMATVHYNYGELLSIAPRYSFNYNQYNYNNYTVGSSSNFTHRAYLNATGYWPKHIIFSHDISYTRNSNIASGFKKDFFLWNASIGYNFFNDKLLFDVKVYDLLNQNTGTTRAVGPTTVVDQENIVQERYFMFSLSYKLEFFGKNKN